MGLADRDYYRAPQSGPSTLGRSSASFGASFGMWSVNTWLIVLCVGVFIVDNALPIVYQTTGNVIWANPDAAHLDADVLVLGQLVPGSPGEVWQTIHQRNNPNVLGWVQVLPMHVLTKYLHFSTRLAGFEFWRFLGFQFLHANLMHLVFNMIGLFFFGPIVEDYLGRKRYLAFYLLCGCCGALLYLLLNGIGFAINVKFGTVAIPGLLFSDPATPLVGASAGIFGVIMAGAFLAPTATVFLLLLPIPLKLRTVAYGLVALAFFTVVTGGNNAGGEAGHLGGAIAGFYFIRRPHHLHNFFDILGRADPTSHHYRDGGTRRDRSHPRQHWRGTVTNPAEVDRILAKINRDGLHSLTDNEKRILAEASER